MRRSQLAINSITTRQNDLIEALDAYAGAGFRNVEFHLPLVKDWLTAGHSVAEAREALAARGLRSIGGFETHLVCFGDAEEREANAALLVENARLVSELGGGAMVVGTDGPATRPDDPLEPLDVIAHALGALAARIAGLDTRVALEFNWSPVVKSLDSAARIAARVNSPSAGVLFDPAHYYVTPTKFESLTPERVRWVRHVHVDDMRDKPPELSDCNSDRALPGEGILDLRALFGRLEEYGYEGYFSIEMFSDALWALPAAEAARRCYQSLLPLCAPEE